MLEGQGRDIGCLGISSFNILGQSFLAFLIICFSRFLRRKFSYYVAFQIDIEYLKKCSSNFSMIYFNIV